MYNLLLLVLSVYGATKIMVEYDGPWGLFYKLRNNLAAFTVLHCVVCLSVWIALLFSILLYLGWYWFITIMAVVGSIIIFEEKL